MTDDTFGFAGKRENTLTKLSSIRPSAESAKTTPLAEIDEAGRRAGFTSREPGARLLPRRRRAAVGATITINTRVPEDIAERFIQFCDQNRLSYWEGIEDLMNRANI